MSFDTVFDYGNAITDVTSKISDVTTNISDINTDISNLQSYDANVWGNIVQPRIDVLNTRKDIYTGYKTHLEAIKSNVQAVIDLGSSDKTELYNFYANVVVEPKMYWMARMVYNTDEMVPKVSVINSELGNLTADEISTFGNIICQQHPINAKVYQVIHEF